MGKGIQTAVITATIIALVSCAKAPVDTGVSNETLGIRLASLPAGFEVANNSDAVLELVRLDDPGQGRIDFVIGPQQGSVNLVAAMGADRSRIEALPGGEYKGGQELRSPAGTAFYSRGRFLLDGAAMEETRILTVHPAGDRMLTLSYVYPAAEDSADRVTELLEVFAEVEAIGQN